MKSIDLIQHVLQVLNSSHEKYELLLPDNGEPEGFTWMKQAYPIASWGRILWSEVDNSSCQMFDNEDEATLLLHNLIMQNNLGNPRILIAWSNQIYPCLELYLESVMRYGTVILSADFDAWIICQENRWVIEKYHEGEICYGKSVIV